MSPFLFGVFARHLSRDASALLCTRGLLTVLRCLAGSVPLAHICYPVDGQLGCFQLGLCCGGAGGGVGGGDPLTFSSAFTPPHLLSMNLTPHCPCSLDLLLWFCLVLNFYCKLCITQTGIKIVGRNINNLRYADDTTLMAESEEELKSPLMKVKEESEKSGLKLNIQKMKIMASGPSPSWQIDGKTMETVTDFIRLQNHCRW